VRILPEALKRIRESKMTPANFIEVFEGLALVAGQLGQDALAVNLDYQDPTDVVAQDDLIPVITLFLRRATLSTTNAKAEENNPQCEAVTDRGMEI